MAPRWIRCNYVTFSFQCYSCGRVALLRPMLVSYLIPSHISLFGFYSVMFPIEMLPKFGYFECGRRLQSNISKYESILYLLLESVPITLLHCTFTFSLTTMLCQSNKPCVAGTDLVALLLLDVQNKTLPKFHSICLSDALSFAVDIT